MTTGKVTSFGNHFAGASRWVQRHTTPQYVSFDLRFEGSDISARAGNWYARTVRSYPRWGYRARKKTCHFWGFQP